MNSIDYILYKSIRNIVINNYLKPLFSNICKSRNICAKKFDSFFLFWLVKIVNTAIDFWNAFKHGIYDLFWFICTLLNRQYVICSAQVVIRGYMQKWMWRWLYWKLSWKFKFFKELIWTNNRCKLKNFRLMLHLPKMIFCINTVYRRIISF